MSTVEMSPSMPSARYPTAVVLDSGLSDHLIRERQRLGIDEHDEVWEGVYMMSPYADDEHQELVSRINSIFDIMLGFTGLAKVRPGVNVSDREENWGDNFRVPDVVVYLQDTAAKCYGPFWKGGPDFGVEVTSKNDRTLDKLEFYAKVGMRELLVVNRLPWQVELFRLEEGRLASVGIAAAEDSNTLTSEVIPFTFQLEAGEQRPVIVVGHSESEQNWRV